MYLMAVRAKENSLLRASAVFFLCVVLPIVIPHLSYLNIYKYILFESSAFQLDFQLFLAAHD